MYCIMMVGLSHSGKTTLAQYVKENYENHICFHIIDTDSIRSMLKQNFSELYMHDSDSAYKTDDPAQRFQKPNFLTTVQKSIVEYSARHNQDIILSNGNVVKEFRTQRIARLQGLGYKVIIIYCNTSETTVLQRLGTSSKNTEILRVSKDFTESYRRQQQVFTPATRDEADYYIEYDGQDSNLAIKQLKYIIPKQKDSP